LDFATMTLPFGCGYIRHTSAVERRCGRHEGQGRGSGLMQEQQLRGTFEWAARMLAVALITAVVVVSMASDDASEALVALWGALALALAVLGGVQVWRRLRRS